MKSENNIAKKLKIISYILFIIILISSIITLIEIVSFLKDYPEYIIAGIIATILICVNALIVPAVLYAIATIVENTHTNNLILRDALLKDRKFEFEIENEERDYSILDLNNVKLNDYPNLIRCPNCSKIMNKFDKCSKCGFDPNSEKFAKLIKNS